MAFRSTLSPDAASPRPLEPGQSASSNLAGAAIHDLETQRPAGKVLCAGLYPKSAVCARQGADPPLDHFPVKTVDGYPVRRHDALRLTTLSTGRPRRFAVTRRAAPVPRAGGGSAEAGEEHMDRKSQNLSI